MRLVLTIGLFFCTVCAAAAEPGPLGEPFHGSTKAFQDQQVRMENKSKAALSDQEARNVRFDERVRRATGSICSGCFAEPTRKARSPKQKAVSDFRNVAE